VYSTFCGGHFPGLAIISCCSRVSICLSPLSPPPNNNRSRPEGITGKFQNPFASPASEIATSRDPKGRTCEKRPTAWDAGNSGQCHRGWLHSTHTWYCRYGMYVHVGRSVGASQPLAEKAGPTLINCGKDVVDFQSQPYEILVYVCMQYIHTHTTHTAPHCVVNFL
jgi:hypothetical protein